MLKNNNEIISNHPEEHSQKKMRTDIYLSTFWPLLKILQILGVFPIRKTKNLKCRFEATKTGIYLIHVTFFLILGYGGQTLCCYYIMSQYDIGICKLLDVLFGLNGSLIDNLDLIGIQVIMVLSSIGLCLGFLTLKTSFIELLELFANAKMRLEKENSHKKKIALFIVISSWILSFIVFTIAFTFSLIEQLDIDTKTTILFAFSNLFYGISSTTPIMVFLMIYSEICQQLNCWMKCLIEKLQSNDHFGFELIGECSTFFEKGLRRSQYAFSGFLFWITTTYLIEMILCAYFAMSFVFDSYEDVAPAKILFNFGFFLVILTLHNINCLSQEVTDNLRKLKESIAQTSAISFEEKWQVIEKMNSFNGFDGYGYFTLGRSHLTSIVANFTTFFIVLIQFKMSENGSADNLASIPKIHL